MPDGKKIIQDAREGVAMLSINKISLFPLINPLKVALT